MLAVTTGAILIISIDRVVLPTVLPTILRDFNLSATAGGFLVSLSFVGTVISAIALGSPSLLQFWRVIMGMGTGGMEPVNVAMVGEWWQREARGFAVGTHHTGFPIG